MPEPVEVPLQSVPTEKFVAPTKRPGRGGGTDEELETMRQEMAEMRRVVARAKEESSAIMLAFRTYIQAARPLAEMKVDADRMVEQFRKARYPGKYPYRVYDKRYARQPDAAPIYYSEVSHASDPKLVRAEYNQRFGRTYLASEGADPLVIERVFEHGNP